MNRLREINKFYSRTLKDEIGEPFEKDQKQIAKVLNLKENFICFEQTEKESEHLYKIHR